MTVFAALIALSFACSDFRSSAPIASAATPPPPASTATTSPTALPTSTATPAPTSTATPTPTPTPAVPSVISHVAAIGEDNPLIAFVSVALSAPARVAVEYKNKFAGKFRTALSELASEHAIPVARPRAGTAYEYAVGVETPDGSLAYAARGAFVSGELTPFAAARSSASGRSSQSLIFADFAATSPGGVSSSRLLMLDELGETVWIYRRANFGAAHVLPNGNLMYMRRGGSDRSFYEITPLGDLVNRAAVGDKDDAPHHDFMALDDGRILYIGRYGFIFDDSANGGRAETTATVDSLNIYDPARGTVERVWDAAKFWDAADPAQRVARSENVGVLNWTHVNSVPRAPDGGYIASVRNRRQIISISPDFQTIRWQLGGPDSDFAFPAPTDRFDMQRAAAQLQNGNVLVFDNRAVLPDESGGYYSRALELRLDFDEMTAVKTWEFTPNPPLYAPVRQQRLPSRQRQYADQLRTVRRPGDRPHRDHRGGRRRARDIQTRNHRPVGGSGEREPAPLPRLSGARIRHRRNNAARAEADALARR